MICYEYGKRQTKKDEEEVTKNRRKRVVKGEGGRKEAVAVGRKRRAEALKWKIHWSATHGVRACLRGEFIAEEM